MDFETLLNIGVGVFVGVVLLDVFLQRKKREEEDAEYIVTSRGRKIYLAIAEAAPVAAAAE